jgi:predicted negative regulator of RcsB-dependent stress response
VASGNLDTYYKASLEQLKDVIVRYPSTQSAVLASLDLSQLYYDHKMYDEASSLLQTSLKNVSYPLTKALVLINLGLNQEAKGDCPGAISSWMKIPGDKSMAAFQGNALIKSALCYEKLNQNDKAEEIFRRFENAEKQKTQIADSIAAKHKVSLHIPPQFQPKENIAAFQKEISQSDELQNIEALLSDRDAVKAAKRYLLLLKNKQS